MPTRWTVDEDDPYSAYVAVRIAVVQQALTCGLMYWRTKKEREEWKRIRQAGDENVWLLPSEEMLLDKLASRASVMLLDHGVLIRRLAVVVEDAE